MPLSTRPRPIWGQTDIGRIVIATCIVITMLAVAFVALKLGLRDREQERASLPGPEITVPAPSATPSGPAATPSPSSSGLPAPSQRPPSPPKAPTDPSDVGVLVNKNRALQPQDYTPGNLMKVNGEEIRKDAGAALERLFAAAKADGHDLSLRSGYRSAAYQQELHERYAATDGEEEADRKSARPGHSEHQTGLAADVTSSDHPALDTAFGETAAGQWLAKHAQEYGFIVRFPQGKESVTGYMWEPWHLRYLGDKLVADFASSGATTLEEFYGED